MSNTKSAALDFHYIKLDEIKYNLLKSQNLMINLGICEEIKYTLAEEISCHLISNRDIERYSLDEWKRKTKPKKRKENDSLSKSLLALLLEMLFMIKLSWS
jgi:hypothetical protein